ncbi:type II CRISPR RNA-guided endonuclease Cas9 [Chitinophaga caeni]|uniref:CRISPR-associated endonuclease Cas9 n=1 Tax=Chitinophaga caeni TaxID=2029983 RepID=A0A291QSP8_9BACT|nr:type II CRISPR RNA-guided endonuclease Cas9 [Chitinophaga caeni]ATL46990.1 type II CRISPR RNA-guided endonuclease Cas9 [Chitinophaga caeni]
MVKNVLGIDLGVTSIGWAFVHEDTNFGELSKIVQAGVRLVALSTDEQLEFEKGKPLSINANRTLKRSMRRNLQRYKMRRKQLIKLFKQYNIIPEDAILAEDGKHTTFETYELRAKAVHEKISLLQFARVLLMLNKKRGYKSSRKVQSEEEGQAIDGMDVAKKLFHDKITPGQYCLELLKNEKKSLPSFYRSDLQDEFMKVWNFQMAFHPSILTTDLLKKLDGVGQKATAAIFYKELNITTAEIKGKRDEKKLASYQLRSDAIQKELSIEEVAFVLAQVNNDINSSSGYLGAIGDKSKELFFNKQTVGEYLYKQLKENPHARLKNQVFYRQDYLDEFERTWSCQAQFHPELTNDLKKEIGDITIFYQRKLKSQKGLISLCQFEQQKRLVTKNGRQIIKTTGYRVCPKSSPLFQEFKVWQNLQNVEIKADGVKGRLSEEQKQLLFEHLNMKGELSKTEALKLLKLNPKTADMNFTKLEANRTNNTLYNVYCRILEDAGYDLADILKVKSDKDQITVSDSTLPAKEITRIIAEIFGSLGIKTSILDFDAQLDGKAFEKQDSYLLWHILYSYESDDSASGNEKLYQTLEKKFGFSKEQAKVLASISFEDDYANLSTKALRKIMPFIITNKYDEACALASYNHSNSLTKEEKESRKLEDRLELIPKNSLRNPVVEKILNQLVHVINAIIEDPNMGKPDEIRIELARELKKNAAEREEMSRQIAQADRDHKAIRDTIQKEFGIANPSRNDIIKFKLYEELSFNGYHDLYTNAYINRKELFSNKYDVDHIIPQQSLFDDSFSNKTLTPRDVNLNKGNRTAYDYIEQVHGAEKLEAFKSRVQDYLDKNIKANPGAKAKAKKLLMPASEIGDGFIERDLRNSQYIAKKARTILETICRDVVATSGSITARLREDWDLMNIMQELNLPKYRAINYTELRERKDGSQKEVIKDWTKRNDHRHHAMDAITVAFTKHNHVQYLNYLNARKNESHKMHGNIIAIEKKETEYIQDKDGNGKKRFKSPMPNFRVAAKKALEEILVSFKAKNKVVTNNRNRYKVKKLKEGVQYPPIQLTPRGSLHKETVYGILHRYNTKEETIGAKFNAELIETVANPKYKAALLQRLAANGHDPKKAFTGKNSPAKNPIYINGEGSEVLPAKVKVVKLEPEYTIRKDITPENFSDEKSIMKVIDVGIRNILLERLKASKDAKEAFSNLDINPIWLNKAKDGDPSKNIPIKRVTITGVSNAEALHHKRDHLGNHILDKEGNKQPVDFVSTGNNHHVAIYRDANGKLQDKLVSFYEAVERANQGLPIIDKSYNQGEGWQFLFTMKKNEYFLFPGDGFDPKEVDLLDPKNKTLISKYLFRVQKLADRYFVFRHHLEAKEDDNLTLKGMTFHRLQSLEPLDGIIKVRINHLGNIVKVGEY